ncbi:ATP-binding protein [Anaerobacillus sp. 1_MG-2023]|uniref:ATP-binding protein n=1 Tax=Anaerobacillus sp. 1_MG-2023 TaxID=3062655 RepID=UPI0026E25F4A|nr:ATP-binding protein [Anaerobacillus sp. 1_MG-2023]MDO6657187.1 ATP-binding protein [Anaerobacillus sp. 1_MG-2023]
MGRIKKQPNFMQAEYIEQEVSEYMNNPFIEALPPIRTFSEVYDSLAHIRLFAQSEKELPTQYRYHLIQRFNQYFQPIGKTIEFERKLSMLMRAGYISRNPHNQHSLYKTPFVNIQNPSTYTNSFTLLGFPGMGKSRNIELLLSQYPQVIVHKAPINRLQITWLKLNCPHDGSLKTLCISFFKTIDELLGTEYYRKFGSKLSVSAMVTNLAHLSKIHAIGVLVIDEIQHLLGKKGSSTEEMMNFFVTLINVIGIPIITIGTMRAKSIVQRDLRQARRSSGLGEMIWENHDINDEDWNILVETLWKNQITSETSPLTKQIKRILYNETQGLVDILIKLFWLSQCKAMELGIEKLDANLIKQVSAEELKLVKPMTEAIKSQDKKKILLYDDIVPLSITEYLNRNSKDPIKIKEKIIEEQKKISKFQEIMNYLKPLELDQYKTEIILKRILLEKKDLNTSQIVKCVLNELSMPEEKPVDQGSIKTGILENIIRLKNQEDSENLIHKYLIQEKIIVSPLDDFEKEAFL